MSPGQTVTAFIKAIERKDIAAAVAMASPEISYENMPISPVVGREGLAQVLEMFLGSAHEVEWQIVSQFEIGATVVNERLDRFQIGDGWLELPIAGFFQIDDDGKVALWRDYFDMGSYQRQFTELAGG